MTNRVHDCLDGELPRSELSEEELARLEVFEATLGEATEALRAAPTPDLTELVMRRLPAPAPATASPGLLDRFGAWLWRPRAFTLSFRPAHGLAAFAVAGLVLALLPGSPEPAMQEPIRQTASAATAPRLYVQFRLEAAEASRVELAGSFTGWSPAHELQETAPGVWSVLIPLDPGVHDYTFVVDGEEWVVDPYAPEVEDSFGGSNSRLFLAAPASST